MNPTYDALRHAFQAHIGSTPEHPAQISVPALSSPSLEWVYANPHMAPMWWKARGGPQKRAGLGIADRIIGTDQDPLTAALDQLLPKLNSPFSYFGGFQFPSVKTPVQEWIHFGTYQWICPLIEWTQASENDCFLAINWIPQPHLSLADQARLILNQLNTLNPPMPIPESTISYLSRQDTPSQTEWSRLLTTTLSTLGPHLQKTVPARRTTLASKSPVSPIGLLSQLSTPETQNAVYEFLFQPHPETSFIGRSPERLLHLKNHHLTTEAVAGTRSDTESAPSLQAHTLQQEHHWVSQMLQESLSKLTDMPVKITPQSTLTIPGHVQHLTQTFSADIRPGTPWLEVLKALYPTPAVSGYPPQKAIEWIAKNEPFSRGWYSGCIGAWNATEIELCVSIRSALVTPRALHLYAGAGLVPGAIPEHEWDELELKISPFLRQATPCP
jgi:menaquinone-specific isochorismate synthase